MEENEARWMAQIFEDFEEDETDEGFFLRESEEQDYEPDIHAPVDLDFYGMSWRDFF
jgi:hypothetical protein